MQQLQLSTACSSDGSAAGLQLNLVGLLGVIAEAGDAQLQSVIAAGGVQQLLALLNTEGSSAASVSEQVQEAAVDALCKLASNGSAGGDAIAAGGGVPALAALLGSGATVPAAEARVRALLCLGMLVGGSPERQLQLAAAPGAVVALLRLLRQQDDADCQQLAAGLFRELAANPAAKGAVGEALKQQQAADAAVQYL